MYAAIMSSSSAACVLPVISARAFIQALNLGDTTVANCASFEKRVGSSVTP